MMLANRAALVTGASGGLGRAIAVTLAENGASVVVAYGRNKAAADEVVAEIEAKGGRAVAVAADVSTTEGADALVKATIEAFGKIDILVNNAGIKRDTLVLRMKDEDWDSVIDTNLRGVFLLCRAAARPMLKAKGGRIINIASIAGLVGNAGQVNYSAAKAGLIGLTKALARELGSRSITVNAVAPGPIDVGMVDDLTEEQKAAFVSQIPLGRLGAAADVANAVLFLASDQAAYITGQTLAVDGGLTMQ
jgi:3-oxoacyl-[acyl-carrier protein] reductase